MTDPIIVRINCTYEVKRDCLNKKQCVWKHSESHSQFQNSSEFIQILVYLLHFAMDDPLCTYIKQRRTRVSTLAREAST